MMTLEERSTSEEICTGILLSMVEILERSGVERSEALAEAILAMREFYESGAAGPSMGVNMDAVAAAVLETQHTATKTLTR